MAHTRPGQPLMSLEVLLRIAENGVVRTQRMAASARAVVEATYYFSRSGGIMRSKCYLPMAFRHDLYWCSICRFAIMAAVDNGLQRHAWSKRLTFW